MSEDNVTYNNGVVGWNCNSPESDKKTDANSKKVVSSPRPKRKFCDICAIGSLLLFGFMFLTLGILTTKFTLYDIAMSERLTMQSWQPSYIWWKHPAPEVLLGVYIFNITNSEEFIAGRDSKLKLQEIGPITFQEVLEHSDVVVHAENSTLSYTVTRRLVYKASANIDGILNQTVVVPNMASLGGATTVADKPLFRIPFSMVMRQHKTRPVVNTTIYNYFFNLTDPVLQFLQNIAPYMVPTTDTGILQNMYKNFTDRVNVQIGVRHGNENFFKINSWNGGTTVPGFHTEKGDCDANIEGSTEGALYPQLITKDMELRYFRKSLCRPVPLHYEQEVQMGNLKAYKFILRDDVFDRFENRTADCYQGSNLPDGLSDLSKCYFDQPIVASAPHFGARSGPYADRLEGLQPNKSKHQSYIIVEPVMGVPLNQRATSQTNVVTKNLRGFKADIARFSDMVIPMFWLEYYLKEITPVIVDTVDFVVNTLPRIQYWISAGFIIFGLCLLMMGYLRLRNNEAVEKATKDDIMKNGK